MKYNVLIIAILFLVGRLFSHLQISQAGPGKACQLCHGGRRHAGP